MKTIKSINVEKELWEKLDVLSKENNRSKSNMIEFLIQKAFLEKDVDLKSKNN